MVLEASIVILDNSDSCRNGDYHPTRWEAQTEAANLIAESKCEKNPENGLGVITMAGKRVEVHVTLTNDLSRILNAIKAINLSGECDFVTALNIATLTLKHRPNKNQKQRIIFFVGSPIKNTPDEMTAIGKKLKKYNIAVDIISFGNVDENKEHLNQFLNAVNSSGNSSILEVPVGYFIMDSLFTSSIMQEVGGYGDVPMEGGENINIPGGNLAQPGQPNLGGTNINQQGQGMSQFERDINIAIQNSLNEERKKAESSGTEKPKSDNDNVDMKPVEEENEEEELEKAKLMSMKEHEDVVKKNTEEEEKVKDELLENQDFIKDILQGINDADINDEDIKDVITQVKDDKKKEEDKKKDIEKKKEDDKTDKKTEEKNK